MHNNIDESLYSRQLYAIGIDTMQSMINSKVLIVNLDPLATEICKNIILSGIGEVTLADSDTKISEKDFGNYYISDLDLGKIRSDILCERLGALNTNCIVNKYSGKLTEHIISKYNLIVFIGCNFDEFYFKLNEYCRTQNIKTIFTSSTGFYGYIFCDFNNYITLDPDGEKIKSGLILSSIKQICVTDKEHDFSRGSKFKMNNSDILYEIIKIVNTHKFIINNDINLEPGEYTEIKDKLNIKFKSLRESLQSPEFIITDFSDFEMPAQIHNINKHILTGERDKLDMSNNLIKKILDANKYVIYLPR